MTAKKYLQSIRKHKQALDRKQDQLQRLYDSVGLTGIDYSKDLVQTSPDNNFEKAMAEISDLRDEILSDIRTFNYQVSEAIQRIEQLDNPTYMDVLYKRYVDIKSLEQIAVEMGYSYEWVRHMHINALDAFRSKHENYLKRTWK